MRCSLLSSIDMMWIAASGSHHSASHNSSWNLELGNNQTISLLSYFCQGMLWEKTETKLRQNSLSRNWTVTGLNPTMRLLNLWDCFLDELWKSLEFGARRTISWWKQSFLEHSNGSWEGSNALDRLKTGLTVIQKGTKTLSTTHLEVIYVIFWPRMCFILPMPWKLGWSLIKK